MVKTVRGEKVGKTVISRFTVIGLTKGNKYGVIEEVGRFYKVCLDNGEIALRHKVTFY